jgi:hypothetical protein
MIGYAVHATRRCDEDPDPIPSDFSVISRVPHARTTGSRGRCVSVISRLRLVRSLMSRHVDGYLPPTSGGLRWLAIGTAAWRTPTANGTRSTRLPSLPRRPYAWVPLRLRCFACQSAAHRSRHPDRVGRHVVPRHRKAVARPWKNDGALVGWTLSIVADHMVRKALRRFYECTSPLLNSGSTGLVVPHSRTVTRVATDDAITGRPNATDR